MTQYGVQATGFRAKPIADTLADLEEANARPDAFGPQIVQTPQSPMGQINGLRADAITEVWEIGAQIAAANDPDQAEGINLNRIAQIRLLKRNTRESDEEFARAITNRGIARIRDADFFREVLAVDGVEWALIYSNDTGSVDERGMDPHSVAVAAIGGDDEAIALVARQYIATGIGQSGNTTVQTLIDGQCRTMRIQRPVEVDGVLRVTIRKTQDADGCPPPSNRSVEELLFAGLTGQSRPPNGAELTLHRVRTALSLSSNIEVISASWETTNGDLATLPVAFAFDEIPRFTLDDIIVSVAA